MTVTAGARRRSPRPSARLAALAICGLLAAAAAAGATTGPIGQAGGPDIATDATLVPLHVVPTKGSYPVFDASGRKVRNQSWRVTSAGGNCCEVYITSTSKGRLVEFGGTYPIFSDDRGVHWTQVTPINPLYNGEGAVVAGPGGDVFAVGWDPYTGDHLQAFKYSAATKTWRVSESPLHSPFYDREWIGFAKGPFTILGQQYPYATVITGGGITKEESLISGDGLTYTDISSQYVDQQTTSRVKSLLRVVKDRNADWWQSQSAAGFTSLSSRGVLQRPTDQGTCSMYSLNSSASWQCFTLKGGTPKGDIIQDSRGWLTNVKVSGSTVTVRVSTDGGGSWQETSAETPDHNPVSFHDVKVNGALGIAVVSAHTTDSAKKTGRDMVFKFDVSRATPRHVETLYVGLGDLSSVVGVVGALSDRMDFQSVAILPDGKLALSFDDSTTKNPTPTKPNGHSPELAIEL